MGEEVRVAYAMSKGALLPLLRHVATRFGPHGIRANAIAPGVIMHLRLASMMPDAAKAVFAEQTSLKGSDSLKTSARLARSCCRTMATFNGQVIAVDGGCNY